MTVYRAVVSLDNNRDTYAAIIKDAKHRNVKAAMTEFIERFNNVTKIIIDLIEIKKGRMVGIHHCIAEWTPDDGGKYNVYKNEMTEEDVERIHQIAGCLMDDLDEENNYQ